jgi:flagellar M-ring protein FliF
MDFLNQAMAQLADLFRSMTPAARITSGLLLAVVIISLAYLFNHQIASGDSFLLGGQSFTSAELSAMEAAFGKAGLNDYSIEGSRVKVPGGQKSAYLAALADSGALPANFGDFLTSAIAKVGPFTSRSQQDELLEQAKERELAGIILSMQGVEKASVQYDREKKTGFAQSAVAKASVGVKRHGTLPLDEKQVPMIRHLVAGAFAGLSPEHVTVVDLNGRTYSANSGDGPGSASEDPFVSRTKEFQAMYETQIYSALTYVPGVTVTANVELNKELAVRQEKDSYDPKAVATLMSREETQTTTARGASGGGRPGIEAQSPNQSARLSSASSGGTESSDESTVNEVQNAPSRERTLTQLAGLTPKRISVSVGIPSTYFESVWRQRNPASPGQAPRALDKNALDQIQKDETDKIRAHVSTLIPQPAEGVDAASLVTVTTFQHVVIDASDGPPAAERVFAWLGNYWGTLATLGLVLFSLLMLRSLARSQPANAPGLPVIAPQLLAQAAADAAKPPEPAKPKSRFKRKLGAGVSLRDELAEMVREDPDAAANILRGWIGNAN